MSSISVKAAGNDGRSVLSWQALPKLKVRDDWFATRRGPRRARLYCLPIGSRRAACPAFFSRILGQVCSGWSISMSDSRTGKPSCCGGAARDEDAARAASWRKATSCLG
jgi:hypothetical protein